MTCLIPLAALCLLSPSDVSVFADASVPVSGEYLVVYDRGTYYPIGKGHQGRFGIMAEPQLTSEIQLRYGWDHTSLLDTNRDRGQERFFVGFTWRPFR